MMRSSKTKCNVELSHQTKIISLSGMIVEGISFSRIKYNNNNNNRISYISYKAYGTIKKYKIGIMNLIHIHFLISVKLLFL